MAPANHAGRGDERKRSCSRRTGELGMLGTEMLPETGGRLFLLKLTNPRTAMTNSENTVSVD